ncbi:hypothetical protein [Serratia phage vB_SmaS_Opt-169]|uniref:Uncharacterized protein n=1 Tax=Serratia phage vB_SmaS_Rovert TaxID=2777363 RepID=A0A7T3NA09_9CAUD|nr:hypothetical protein QJS24_gp23 [Serratia phage vB_SmaS_Rovert]QPX74991.1 hypothetical protein [Serratia phage vB_SmaS_Rovert]QPX75437.1 hypothetical protein [Serratia phage vB_SmaS_Opt-169]UGO51964.1 hypothetical protein PHOOPHIGHTERS_30 [Serratia phage vB_SmaS_PhooPhighters]
MSNKKPFLIVHGKTQIVVFAMALSTAEAHAKSIATKDLAADCVHLPTPEYRTTDFTAINRVPGGKDDADVFPFKLTINGESEVVLASSKINAEKALEAKIQEKAGYSVTDLPVDLYGKVKWETVETLAEPEPTVSTGKRGRPAKNKDAAAEDAHKQTEMAGENIPGME